MDGLTVDVISLVLRLLCARDVVSCSRVSRKWHAASLRSDVCLAAARERYCCDAAFRHVSW